MAIFNSYVSLPEGKFPLSYGFPMVFPFFDADKARDEPICGEPGDADHHSSSRQGEVRLPRAPDARHDLPAGHEAMAFLVNELVISMVISMVIKHGYYELIVANSD